LVALRSVRVLLLSAKHLILAASALRTRRPAAVMRYEEVKQHRRRLTRSGSGERIHLHFVFDRVVKIGKVFTGDVGHFPPVFMFHRFLDLRLLVGLAAVQDLLLRARSLFLPAILGRP
jgi:hypothetical protein